MIDHSLAGGAAHDPSVRALVSLAESSQRMVAFTGAGISTESGIPDYRGPGGVWQTGQIPTISDFLTNPETRRTYWEGRRTRYPELAAKDPNSGHLALAALQRTGRLGPIITQNIDGLHQKAGSDPESVIELHGSSHRHRCLTCARVWPAARINERLLAGETEPACEVCGGILRGGTVLFGEPVPVESLRAATAAVMATDLILVVGSSLVVSPAAQLPVLARRAGASVAIVNRTPTPLDGIADVLVRIDAGPALTALVDAIGGAPLVQAAEERGPGDDGDRAMPVVGVGDDQR